MKVSIQALADQTIKEMGWNGSHEEYGVRRTVMAGIYAYIELSDDKPEDDDGAKSAGLEIAANFR